MSAHAPDDGHSHDAGHEAHDAASHAEATSNAANAIELHRWGTTNHIRKVVGDMKSRAAGRNWEPLPDLPSLQTLGKAAAVGTAVAMPQLAVAAYAGKKTYDLAVRHTPLRHVDNALRNGANTVLSEAKTIASIPLYPVRLTTAVGMNALKAVEKAGTSILSWGTDFISDIETAINHQYNLPEGTNLPAQLVIGTKQAIGKFVYGVAGFVMKHPIISAAGATSLIGLAANAGVPLGSLGAFGQSFLTILERAGNFFLNYLPK